jgi:hypothetical protein
MFGVGGDLQQGLRAGAEQEVIKDLLVHQYQLRKLVREDDMDIGNVDSSLWRVAIQWSRAWLWHLGQYR